MHVRRCRQRRSASCRASNVRAEAATLRDRDYAQALLDLKKCFEHIPHHRIRDAAAKNGHSLWLLRLSLQAYRMPCSIGVAGIYSRLVVAVRGIGAGSGFATTELHVLLLDAVDSTYRLWRQIDLAPYVDDMNIESHGTASEARSLVAGTTDHVTHAFQDLDLEVSAKKSTAIAGRTSLAASLVRAMASRKVTAAKQAKMLGAPAGGGRRRAVRARMSGSRPSTRGSLASMPCARWACAQNSSPELRERRW